MPPIFRLLRPKQWTKNLLALAAVLFTARFDEPNSVVAALLAVVSLSLVSSFNYVINDLLDVERDRLHPKKKLRPIASGEVSRQAAMIMAALCLVGGLGIAMVPGVNGSSILGSVAAFVLVQLMYSLALKKQPVLDVVVLSLLYVGRAAIGAQVIDATISGWLLFCTGSLALMLAVGKRRQELRSLGGDTATREVLRGYSLAILDPMLVFSAGLAALGYGVYAIESQTAQKHPGLVGTVPFVIYGVLRVLYLVFQGEQGEEPESLVFGDLHIGLSLLGFVAVSAWVVTQGGAK